jgi:F420-0:gamma-glutamyl ligase
VYTVKVAPGFNTLSEEDFQIFLKPKDIKRAIDAGALVINAGVSDVKDVDHQIVTPPKSPDEKAAEKEKPIEVKTRKRGRKKKKADDRFKEFD